MVQYDSIIDPATGNNNYFQMADGAAGVLLARRSTALKLNLPILAKWVDYALVGVSPNQMAAAHVTAIPAVVTKCGLRLEQVDIF